MRKIMFSLRLLASALFVFAATGLPAGAWAQSAPLTDVQAVAAGGNHTCALTRSGSVKCWGDNGYGQLGDGSDASSRTAPVDVSGIRDAKAISGGYGQLGDGSTTHSTKPVAVSSLSGVTAVVGEAYHTCEVVSDGSVKCWGSNGNGRLGDGSTTLSATPVAVSGLKGATSVVGEVYHTCARIKDGTVRCWGRNRDGQLGDGSTTNRAAPVTVSGLSGAAAIAAGASLKFPRTSSEFSHM